MQRVVTPELLDALAPDDPRARASRRDLRRINALMGNARLMAEALDRAFPMNPPRRIIDLGGGDGQFVRQIARRLRGRWKELNVTIVDRVNSFEKRTNRLFTELGWHCEFVVSDALKWLRTSRRRSGDAIVANLFLHHFQSEILRELLRLCAERASVFVAVEPRRAVLPLITTKILRAARFHPVTCHDAAVSVRAGFTGDELSRLWPCGGAWKIAEHAAGFFSHRLIVCRIS